MARRLYHDGGAAGSMPALGRRGERAEACARPPVRRSAPPPARHRPPRRGCAPAGMHALPCASAALPHDDDACGWTALLPPLPPPRRLHRRASAPTRPSSAPGSPASPRRAGWRRCGPQWRIAVLDAQRVGDGASGRNSGFVVDLPHYVAGARSRGQSAPAPSRPRRAAGSCASWCARTRIDCDWTERGRLHGAGGDAGMRALERFCAGAEALGEPYQRLDRAALAALTGTTYYRAGARTPGTVHGAARGAGARAGALAAGQRRRCSRSRRCARSASSDGFALESDDRRRSPPRGCSSRPTGSRRRSDSCATGCSRS